MNDNTSTFEKTLDHTLFIGFLFSGLQTLSDCQLYSPAPGRKTPLPTQ